jgi:predicted dehydrogenase
MPRFPVCVLGAGPAGRNYIKQLQAVWDVEVVGFANRSDERRRAVAAETGLPGFAGLPELLRGVRTRPRLAVIATANATHKDLAIACLEAGLDVFCEKPMAMTRPDCEAMLAAEQRTGRVLQIGFEYRYGSMTERLTALRDGGWFGALTSVDITDARGHWWPERPDAPLAEVWRLNREAGGGPVVHCGIHQLDLLRHYAGEVAEVMAFTPPRSLPFYPADMPDHLRLQLRFVSGASGSLTITHNRGATWYRPIPQHQPNYHQVPGHGMDIVITGRAGGAIAQLYQEELHLLRYDVANRETVLERTESFHHHHPQASHHNTPGMIVRLARRLAAGDGALHSAADAYRTTILGLVCETAVQEALADGWRSGVHAVR